MTRSQLQLLGAVCLLVSWKVRDHSPITAQRLIEYTDYNVDLAALLVSARNLGSHYPRPASSMSNYHLIREKRKQCPPPWCRMQGTGWRLRVTEA